MRNTVIWSFLSLVALASGGLITGCDSDDASIKSALGESCDKTSDCADGLKCLQGTCYQASSSGGSSNEGGDGSGGTVVGPTPPVLGGEGETCTKRADCEDGLSCISSRCTADGGGEGGSGTAGPRLGKPGETCVVSSDCEKNLACIPGGYPFEGINNGVGFIGICSVATTLTPTGKTCGAECREAADCCELPVARHVALGASSCAGLVELIGNVKTNCKAPVAPALQAQCFAYETYCNCAEDSWSCDAGLCSFQGECTLASADVPNGCPSVSRAGYALPGCNEDGACAPTVTPTELCKRDSDCETKAVTNDPTGGGKLCAADECVCQADSGQCYRKCDADLDCAVGYTCDTDTSICVQSPSCKTNEECFTGNPNINRVCDDGTCKQTCNSQLDCLAADVTLAEEGPRVCGADHFCAPLGCSSDDQCAAAGSVKLFCTEAPAGAAGPALQSAVTD